MTDEALRQLIREAVARHTGQPARGPLPSGTSAAAGGRATGRADTLADASQASMAFSLYVVPRPTGETDCVIEPGTRCDHCGYCLSHGH